MVLALKPDVTVDEGLTVAYLKNDDDNPDPNALGVSELHGM
jgi:hypothetical protein